MGIQINGQTDTIKADDGSLILSGEINANVTGNLTGDVTGTATTATNALNIKDSAGNVRISSNESGMVMSGITTVTSGKLMVGNAYVDSTAVGVGTTDTAGRNAGIGTMTGSMIFNTTTSSVQVWDGSEWQEVSNTISGMTATGGIIGDYTESGPGKIIRTHTFKSSGTFVVSQLSSTLPNSVDYLVVAGGGAGGAYGGGGAGGLRSSHPSMPAPLKGEAITVTAQTYPVTVGAGAGGFTSNDGMDGNDSVFSTITSNGGGGGGGDVDPGPGNPGRAGGSGGGANRHYPPFGPRPAGAGNTPPRTPPQGNPGGAAPINGAGGGGGGASEAGEDTTGSPGFAGKGGDGLLVSITGVSTHYAGGGGGGAAQPGGNQRGLGGAGGGGNGHEWPASQAGSSGAPGTGGGGGGGGNGALSNIIPSQPTMFGGSGIVVLSYQIGNQDTATAKATGGSVSFYNGKTIHTFTSSSTFTALEPLSVEYVAIGGGGGGGAGNGGGGGGGGAGLFLNETGISVDTSPFIITVGAGGNSANTPQHPNASTRGNSTVIAFPSGTKTATYGGGGHGANNVGNGDPGGSGGGAGNASPSRNGGTGLGDSYPGSPGTTPSNGWGSSGGSSSNSTPEAAAGGGGGAGGAGTQGTSTVTGHGGAGVQLPSAFRDPQSATALGRPGPGGASYWVAAGGGGGAGYAGGPGQGPVGTGGGPGGPFAGAGDGGYGTGANVATAALSNTGSGGGGVNTISGGLSGQGGSGIVIISYPT